MYKQHEYAVIGGVNRARIGHLIGMVAAMLSAFLITAVLGVVGFLRQLGVAVPPVILWPVTAFFIYGVLYFVFDRYFWKLPKVSSLLKVPHLSGDWNCKGRTLASAAMPAKDWVATVTILQSWDRIRVRLKTPQSASNSVAAALIYDEVDGYRLMYSYENEPKIGESDLRGHRGYAEFVFSRDLKSAVGEYFNGHGRYTFGTMALEKVG